MSFKRIKNIPLLEFYKQTHGDLAVPPNFIVPKTAPWPPTANQTEFNLGQYVSHIRQQRKKNNSYYEPNDVNLLDDLGFVWNVSDQKSKKILEAAETYHKLHGNLNMKHRFVVPTDDEKWPRSTWGIKLQSTLQNIKHVGIHETIHEPLQRLGLVLEHHDALHTSSLSNTVSESTNTQRGDDSEENPINDEEVKNNDNEDENKRGNTRCKKSRVSTTVVRSIEHIAELRIYHKLKKDLMVPVNFKVPTNDPDWPAEFQNFELGSFVFKLRLAVKKSRRSFNPDDIDALNELGFVWDLSDSKAESVMTALRTYKKLNHNLTIMYKFVVPINDISWPKCTWGIKLGTVLNNIKYNGSYANKRDELIALGIDFNVGHNLGPSPSGEINPNTLGYIKRNRGSLQQMQSEMRTHHVISSHQQPNYMNNNMMYPLHDPMQDHHMQLHHHHRMDAVNSDSEDEENEIIDQHSSLLPIIVHSASNAMVGGAGSMLPLINHATLHNFNDQQFMPMEMTSSAAGMTLDALSQHGRYLSMTSSSHQMQSVPNIMQQAVSEGETHHQLHHPYYLEGMFVPTGQHKRKIGDL